MQQNQQQSVQGTPGYQPPNSPNSDNDQNQTSFQNANTQDNDKGGVNPAQGFFAGMFTCILCYPLLFLPKVSKE